MGDPAAHEIVDDPATPGRPVDLGEIARGFLGTQVVEGHGRDDDVHGLRPHGEIESVALDEGDLRVGARVVAGVAEGGAPRSSANTRSRRPCRRAQRTRVTGMSAAPAPTSSTVTTRSSGHGAKEAADMTQGDPPTAEEPIEPGDGVEAARDLREGGGAVDHLDAW